MFCLNLDIEMCFCYLSDQSTYELRTDLLSQAKEPQVRRSPSLKGSWTHSTLPSVYFHYINPRKLKYFITASKTLASFAELEWLKSLSCLSTMNVLQRESDRELILGGLPSHEYGDNNLLKKCERVFTHCMSCLCSSLC